MITHKLKAPITRPAQAEDYLRVVAPQSRLPEIYRQSEVRVVTPSDGQCIGIGFDHDGTTTRVRLTVQDATQLAELLNAHLAEKT